jgi:hypothetical protein
MERDDKKTILKSSTAKACLGFLLLAAGCMIYLLFRSKTLYIYVWCKALGLSTFVDAFREHVQNWNVSDFVRFSLPDGFYCAAYILMIDAIWHDDNRKVKYILLSLVPIITVVSEILQLYGVVRGTFDLKDLLCYLIPPLAYIMITFINNFKYNY